MATYPSITTLAGLNSTPGLNNPAQLDSASELAASVRQIKSFLYTFLGQALDDDGSLKTDAVTSATIADRSIAAIKLVLASITDAELAANAVIEAKIAAGAVSSTKLADLAVATAKIADAAVTAAKLADGTVTGVKLADLAVSTAKLANNAVSSAKLADGAVGSTQLADNAVSPAKISNIGANKLLVGDGSATVAADIGGVLSASLVGGVLTFALGGVGSSGTLQFATCTESEMSGVGAGDTVAATWQTRGDWDATGQDPAGLLSISAGVVTLPAGDFVVRIMVPGYSCGLFKTRLRRDPLGTPVVVRYGSSVVVPIGGVAWSLIQGQISVPTGGAAYDVQSYAELAQTNGLGFPTGITGINEQYSLAEFIKYA